MSELSKFDLLVIGAGITGLTLGYLLKKKGARVAILEKSNRAGGILQTKRVERFQVELGANSFLLKARPRELLAELNLTHVPVAKDSKARFVVLDDKVLRQVPISALACLTTDLLSFPQKLRLLLEPFQTQTSSEDTTVFEFIERRLGTAVAENLVAPFFNGVYAGDISLLSARTALPLLFNAEKAAGSILRGMLQKRSSGKKKTVRPEMVQFAGGMSELVDKLATALGDSLLLGQEIESLNLAERGYLINSARNRFTASHVILTPDTLSTARLVSSLDPTLAEAITNVPYAPVGMLYVSTPKKFQGVGFLRTPKVGNALLGALYTSSSFPHTAPKEESLITCFLGGSLNPNFADPSVPETQKRALTELSEILELQKPPRVIDFSFWQRAIPNYPVGHYLLLEKLKAFEAKNNGIHFAGNWLEKPGVGDCMERAILLSEELTSKGS